MSKQLEGKVAVITGGSSGIGLATAKRFVEEGAHVVITGRRETELKAAAGFIKGDVMGVVGDVSRLEDLDRLYAVVKEKHGHIDILFANAGAGTIAPLEAATEGQFDQMFDVNVKGLFFTVQKALPLFKDGGSIILTSSVANVLGVPGFSAYAASKAAVRNFARAWTLELKDRGIRVNAMSPGPTETPALATTTGLTPEQAEQAAGQFAAQIPMGRRGKPEEIAGGGRVPRFRREFVHHRHRSRRRWRHGAGLNTASRSGPRAILVTHHGDQFNEPSRRTSRP